jgi:NTE family protein
VNLALQGDGAHGAFAWGVLDRLLEEPRIAFEGVSATGAGAVNAAVLAYGLAVAGRNGARAALANFWRRISHAGLQPKSVRAMLEAEVDFDRLRNSDAVSLQLGATAVRARRLRIFEAPEIGLEQVMASASGGTVAGEAFAPYHGAAARFPFFPTSRSREAVLVRATPTSPMESLPCQAALRAELQAVTEVSRRVDRGAAAPDALRRLQVHPIEGHGFIAGLGVEWGLMTTLRDLGRAKAAAWLADDFERVGRATPVAILEPVA